LKALLGLADQQLHSVIYFIGDCTFKTPMPDNVMNRGLIRYIKEKTTQVLTPADIIQVVKTIQQTRLTPNWQTHRQHVAQLKARHLAPSRKSPSAALLADNTTASSRILPAPTEQSPACPRCGNLMVLRTASRGEHKGTQFWGCSGYPKCRGMTSFKITR
ncbi:topoisomerase DNA-binding C4 zinc finger domain-containing protein, partial [Aeromonas caviae]